MDFRPPHSSKSIKTRTLNKEVAEHLPNSNDPISLCLRDYEKTILNMKSRGDRVPPPPTEDQVQVLNSKSINTIDPNNNFFNMETTNENLYGGKKSIPGKFKEQCQKELESYGIHVPTFQWDHPIQQSGTKYCQK